MKDTCSFCNKYAYTSKLDNNMDLIRLCTDHVGIYLQSTRINNV